jgi:hypothetical protein
MAMKKGIDDQLVFGGGTSQIPIKNIESFLSLLPGYSLCPLDDTSTNDIANHTAQKARRRVPEIFVNDRQLIDIIEDAWGAIKQGNQAIPKVFIGYGALVHLTSKVIIKGLPAENVIELMNVAQVYGHLIRNARWMTEKK